MKVYHNESSMQGTVRGGNVNITLQNDSHIPQLTIHVVHDKRYDFTIPELLDKLGIEIKSKEDNDK